MVERHYDAEQLAELLGISVDTVREKARTGELGSVRLGRLRRFPESEVNKYLRRHRNVVSFPINDQGDDELVDQGAR